MDDNGIGTVFFFFFFERERERVSQPMAFASDDSSLSSNKDTNWFLV